MTILLVAFESGRWGPARLPAALAKAGFKAAALCPNDNALAHTAFLSEYFQLNDVHSSRKLEQRLCEVMKTIRPKLIIPCDERTVAYLHSLVRQPCASSRLGNEIMDIIRVSLGDPKRFEALLLKDQTLELAREHAIATPESKTVCSPQTAIEAAREIGFPVFLKRSFSWAGEGVVRCDTEEQIERAFEKLCKKRRLALLRRLAKRLVHRDWYPADSRIQVQKCIKGESALYCGVAWNGKMLAGFAGIRKGTVGVNGPSTHVWIGHHEAIQQASQTMIKALGATGFIGFDFMIESRTGKVFLIECNPRPVQVNHLGVRIGVDLCAALAKEISGQFSANPGFADRSERIAIYPAAKLGQNAEMSADYLDAPYDDPPLMKFMRRAVAFNLETVKPLPLAAAARSGL